MLNSVGERTPPCGTPVFKLTLFGCVISICCVGFASLDVVCDELNDCVESFAHIECYSDCSRRGSHLVEPFCYGVV